MFSLWIMLSMSQSKYLMTSPLILGLYFLGTIMLISFILEQLNINPYASTVTLLCAYNGAVMVDRTHYITTLYEKWNITKHSSFPQGFRLPYILNEVFESMEALLKAQVEKITLGGQSVIVLLIPSPVAYVPEYDYIYSKTLLEKLNSTLPDVHYLYFSGGAVVRWKDFVSNPHDDLFPLDFYQSIENAATPVVKRIAQIPRRIFNPGCFHNPVDMIQVMSTAGITFYRVLPMYFYTNTGPNFIKIQAKNGVLLTVCTSRRSMKLSNRNTAQQGCQQVTPTTEFDLDMGALCYSNLELQDCAPLYLTVMAPTYAEPSQVICSAPICQTAYMVQYVIQVSNSGCNNSLVTFTTRTTIILLLLFFILLIH